MPYHYIACFFAGAFLANAIPHVVNGISGRPFQTPFASPPGKGLSSATINVLWGALNLVLAWVLLCDVGPFNLSDPSDAMTLGAGALILALWTARHFGRLHGGNI